MAGESWGSRDLFTKVVHGVLHKAMRSQGDLKIVTTSNKQHATGNTQHATRNNNDNKNNNKQVAPNLNKVKSDFPITGGLFG